MRRRRHVDPAVVAALDATQQRVHRRPPRPGRRRRSRSGWCVPTARAAVFVPGATATRLLIPLEAQPEPGQTQERTSPSVTPVLRPADRLQPVRGRGHPVQPVHVPGDRPRQRDRAPRGHRALRARPERRRLGGHGPAVHDAAAPADRGVARPGRGRPEPPRARRPRSAPARRRSPSSPSSSTRWPTGSRRASRSSAATATGAATSWPTCRTSCGRRWPRCGRSTSCSRRGPPTTPRRAPSSSSRAASRSSGSTGWPRTCSSCRSSIRGSSCSTCGRTTCGRRSRSAVEQSSAAAERRGIDLGAAPARRARSGSGTTRSGSARSSANLVGNAVKFTPRGGSVTVDVAATPDGRRIDGRRHGRRHRPRRAAAHLRAVLPRLAGQRGARQRQRPRPGDRPLDRRHARRPVAVESRVGDGIAVHRRPAARSAAGRGDARRPSGPTSPRRPTPRCDRAPADRRRASAAADRNVQETSPSERSQVNPEPAP